MEIEGVMGQTVYVDLFFMINFSMDFLCFFLTSKLLSDRLSIIRTLIASAIGGVYANLALFIGVGGISEILLDIAVCALMCLVAFGKCRSLLLHTAVYIVISIVLGGFMTALFGLLNRAELPLDGLEGDGLSAWLLALLAAVSGALTLAGGRFFRKKSARRYTKLTLELDGRQRTLDAFCDSGNLLREPISGRACIVTDTDALKGIFPDEILKMARSGGIPKLTPSANLAKRIRIVPTHSATGDGILIAVRPERIFIGEGKSAREVDALIALCTLGQTADGAQALVPTELMN